MILSQETRAQLEPAVGKDIISSEERVQLSIALSLRRIADVAEKFDFWEGKLRTIDEGRRG